MKMIFSGTYEGSMGPGTPGGAEKLKTLKQLLKIS